MLQVIPYMAFTLLRTHWYTEDGTEDAYVVYFYSKGFMFYVFTIAFTYSKKNDCFNSMQNFHTSCMVSSFYINNKKLKSFIV